MYKYDHLEKYNNRISFLYKPYYLDIIHGHSTNSAWGSVTLMIMGFELALANANEKVFVCIISAHLFGSNVCEYIHTGSGLTDIKTSGSHSHSNTNMSSPRATFFNYALYLKDLYICRQKLKFIPHFLFSRSVIMTDKIFSTKLPCHCNVFVFILLIS